MNERMNREGFVGGTAAAIVATLLLGLATACAPPPAATGNPPAKRVNAETSDCASMKRQQQAMVARGQENTQAYRTLLDSYLRQCFNR